MPRYEHGSWQQAYLAPVGSVLVAPAATDDRDTRAADYGTAMHAAKAGDGTEPFRTWMEPYRDRFWPPELGAHEVAMSYNCRTGEADVFDHPEQDMRDAWKESHGDDWVVGTCDWYGWMPTGEPWVDDLKTGWKTPEVMTPQMLFYALVAWKVQARAEGQDTWLTVRVSITHMPRVRKGEDPEPSRSGLWRQVTDTMLLAFEGQLKQAWVRATGLNPEPRPGAHCTYCPSALACDKANQ